MKKTAFLNTAHTKAVLLCLALGLAASQAEATTITQNVTGSGGFGGFFAAGQSVTTPTGGPWDHLTFNFVNNINAAPYASGGLFLLTQSYTGAPGTLSAAAPGFLASTNTISSGVWSFATNVTVNANTPYFLYMNSNITQPLRGSFSNVYAGGNAFLDNSSDASSDFLFNLSGDVVVASQVPEPGTAPLMGLGLAGFAAARRRSRSI